jgi:hypothetical protein
VAGWGACAPRERIGVARSVLGVYNLRVYGSIRKQGIKSLLELSHHAIDQVLVAGSLSVSVRIDQCGKFLLVHR